MAARPAGPLPGGLIGLVALAIGLLWVGSGFYVVDEQERAVVLRFGQYVGTTEPGLRWRVPWPGEQSRDRQRHRYPRDARPRDDADAG